MILERDTSDSQGVLRCQATFYLEAIKVAPSIDQVITELKEIPFQGIEHEESLAVDYHKVIPVHS